MKKQSSLLIAAAVAAFTFSTFTEAHSAVILYSDAFGGVDGAGIRGASPDTNVTGAVYLTASRGSALPTYTTAAGNPAGSAFTSFNGSVALSLASGGGYTRPVGEIFTISADLSVNTTTGSGTINNPPAGSTRGVGLGFYSTFANVTNADPFGTNYTGFNLQNSGGGNAILQFVNNGVSTGFAGLQVFTGTFNTASFYNLTYTVDTSTGNLTSLFFNGADLTSSFAASATGAFTTADTALAGFGASSSTAGVGSRVDNFSVMATVPEPSAFGLLAMGAAGVLLRRRRRMMELA